MGYKDSFVDEFPYLVYSDDPEAIGTADASGDPGSAWGDADGGAYIANGTGGNIDIYAASDQGRRYLAGINLTPDNLACDISRNAFLVIPTGFNVEVYANTVEPETSVKLDPIATVAIHRGADRETGYVYPLDDVSVDTYEITSING